jgi:gliding motility-associated-like protein
MLNPADMSVCAGQNVIPTLDLLSYTGSIVNWQSSYDSVSWNDFTPTYQNSKYNAGAVNKTTYYRTIVKSGVCPADTSTTATIRYINVPFPAAAIDPDSSYICYGKSALLNATITSGTSYNWSNNVPLTGAGNGTVGSVPYTTTATATPKATSNVVLTVYNAGCPNALKDTFYINVTSPIIVSAGDDTAVVVNQPLQFDATVNDENANIWSWTPSTGLNNSHIPNPVGVYGSETNASITYVVTATTSAGCSGSDTVVVKVFKTPADIFMPTAFTPNGDGRNDVIRPVLVGIKSLTYFRVYNRWGQLIFTTSQAGKGWDGTVNGALQATDNFVYMVQAVDYTGKTIFKKGDFVLIR